MDGLAPTMTSIGWDDLENIRQLEWDVAVLYGGFRQRSLAAHLFVLVIGAGSLGTRPIAGGSQALEFGAGTVSTEFVIGQDVPNGVATLVERDLLPLVLSRAKNPVAGRLTRYGGLMTVDEVDGFLADPDGRPLAGRFARSADAETWFVPSGADVAQWLRVALDHWSTVRPSIAPEPTWSDDPRWMTPGEAAAYARVKEREAGLAALIVAEEHAIAQARSNYEAERRAAEEGMRRLLTAKGEELVDVVLAALVQLGFACEERDEVNPKGSKLEDLRLTAPDSPGWVALAEVRGYSRGAKVNDLLRLARFVTAYVKQSGELPASVWYIVNSFIAAPPSGRDVPLASHPDEVETFAESGGLVVDTCDLFTLWRAVAGGEMDPADARSLLMVQGRLILPSDPPQD